MTRALSLRARIVLCFVSLLAVVQVATLVYINSANYDAARTRIGDELDIGERVFARLLSQDADRLSQAARTLAADFAFREAVATGDAPTLESALENLGERVHASGTLFVDRQGAVRASTLPGAEAGFDGLQPLVAEARRAGEAHRIITIGGHVYQVVAVPVRAPVTVGWVVLCFPVDVVLARELRHLTGLDVSFLVAHPGGWRSVGSTLPASDVAALGEVVPASALSGRAWSATRADGMHLGRALDIGSGSRVVAVLERPMEPALRYSRDLRNVLLGLGALSLLLSTVFSVFVARGITRPLDRLRDAVGAIRGGDYAVPVVAERDDEVGAVARGLDHMRVGIREREQRILTLAYEDSLTGLPNRVRFNDELGTALARAARDGTALSILVLGLDRFRNVNDTLGHAAGDDVLAQIGARLATLAGGGRCVARLGSDEFALLLPGADATAAVEVARAAQALLEQPVQCLSQPVDVRASMGIASFPAHGPDAQTLLRHADIAMHAAKQARSGVACFDPAIDDAQKDHLSLLGELSLAVERDELEVHYQPKVDLRSGHIGAAEALLRWRHPVRGRVPPGLFIPFAEQTGYVKVLTRWVLREVVRQTAAWMARGIEVQVAVNLSARDLMSEDLPDYVAQLLGEFGLPAQLLRLEVTESGFLDDPHTAQRVLEALAARGHRLSIDDYGTGYSSLTYLRRLPVDELKIDRSFVAGMAGDAHLATIVASTVEMGHGLGMKIVAEGVEDDDVRRRLTALGCDAIQGYLISPPLPALEFERWLAGALPLRHPARTASSPVAAALPVERIA